MADTTIEKQRGTIPGVPWSWSGTCKKCRRKVFYTVKKKWQTNKGIIIARLCMDCARELDTEFLLGKWEGKEIARKAKKLAREKDKLAKKGWDELKSKVKHK